MIQAIDHVVILVRDLAQATADYQQLGFTVTPGGEHTGGGTHNVLVCFVDGSYLELIAFRRPMPEHSWYRHVAHGEGLIDFALLPSSIDDDLAAARARGLDLEGPLPGGRVRPDGVQLVWQTGRSRTADLPFFCADVTERSLRVPSGAACMHPNGVQGIATLAIAVADVARSTARYRALLGIADAAPLQLGNTSIRLCGPETRDLPVAERLASRGEGPLALTLTALEPVGKVCDLQLSHAVHLLIS